MINCRFFHQTVYPGAVLTHGHPVGIQGFPASVNQLEWLLGGFNLPTPLKNHGVRQLGWWHSLSQLFLDSHKILHGSSQHQPVEDSTKHALLLPETGGFQRFPAEYFDIQFPFGKEIASGND